jgi:hypothetical protein
MWRVSSIVLFLCLVQGLSAQSYSSDDFFRQSLSQLHQLEILTLDPVSFPWIEEIELRTETRDFDLDMQEIMVRVSPSTPQIRRAQAALLAHYRSEPDKDSADLYGDVVLNLYGDWLSLYFIERELAITDSLQLVLADRQKVLARQLGTLDIDLRELVRLETDRNDLAQKVFELELEKKALVERYGLEATAVSHRELISLDDIKANLVSAVSSQRAASDGKTQWEREGLNRELALEEAERKKVIDFIQFKYRGPSADLFREKYSLGLGFRLPTYGNRKLKVAELIHEKSMLDKEVGLDVEERAKQLVEVRSDLVLELTKAEHFFDLKNQERKHLDELENLIKNKVGFNPQIVLQIKEHHLKESLKSLEYLEDIYFDYLKLLSVDGRLSTVPFVNYLKA